LKIAHILPQAWVGMACPVLQINDVATALASCRQGGDAQGMHGDSGIEAKPLRQSLDHKFVVFAGHVHNYQRSVPLRFLPEGERDKNGKVNRKFTLDLAFDGGSNTRPTGVIHIVAGGGGAVLYGPGLEKSVAQLHKEHGDNYGNYAAKMVTDRHTFVVMDLTPERLQLWALAADREDVDRIIVTKQK
jgi:hypothetical protein